MRRVGVVPAAGHATRLQPLAGSKELCRVAGRPVMDHLLERMTIAGCGEIRVVTRPEKRDVILHAAQAGATVVEGHPATVGQSLALGLGGLDADDEVLFGFPDTLWQPPDGFVLLLDRLRTPFEIVLGVLDFARPERSDTVHLGEGGTVRRIEVRPLRPSSTLVWGCFAARARALAGVERPDEPGRHLDGLARAGVVAAVRLSGELVDIGTPEALAAHAG